MGFRKTTNHRIIATFYRHAGEPIELLGGHGDGALAPGVGGPASIVSASTSKTMGGGMAGTFTITLKRGSLNIMEEIRAGDWVILHFTRNGKPLHGTLGMILDVREQRTPSSESITITGADFGRVIDRTEVWFDDFTGFENNAGGKLIGGRMGFNPIGSPDQIVQRIIDAMLGSDTIVGGTWTWPQGLNYLGKFFTAGLKVSIGNRQPVPLGVVPVGNIGGDPLLRGEGGNEFSLFRPNPGTTLTQQLQSWVNPMLNELFFDVADDQVFISSTAAGLGIGSLDSTPDKPYPTLFMREKPFINLTDGLGSPWFKLPTVKLHGDDITTSDLGFSDEERRNLIMIYAGSWAGSNLDQYVAYPPGYSRESMARYGLRKHEQQTTFATLGGRQGGAPWLTEVSKWAKLLIDWYALNHEFLNGSISTPYLLGEARIGKRLLVEGEHRRQFYIEGVTHTVNFPRGASTRLSVTRGFEGEDGEFLDRLDDAVGDYRRRSSLGGEGLQEAPTSGIFVASTNAALVEAMPEGDVD